MITPLFLVPLKVEALAVRSGARTTQIDQFGMGPRRSTALASRLMAGQHFPRPTVLLGVAGGLHQGDRPGDVVVADRLGFIGGGETISLPEALDVAGLLADSNIIARSGAVVSATAIVHGDANRDHAAREGALAVDMESYWCGVLAKHHPFAVVRVLLDVPGRELRSPAVIPAIREAFRSLKAVARTLAHWSPVSVDAYPLLENGER